MDQTILFFFNQTLAHPLLDLLMLGITYSGLALLPALGVVLLLGKHRRVGLAILGAIATSLILTFIFQYLALRPRPEAVRLLQPMPNFPSFPSGHAAVAFATAVVLGLVQRHWSGWLLALAGAGLIALSRVYLGCHYPSDILGGAILGAGTGAAGYGLLVDSRLPHLRWRWLLWPQVALVALITEMAYLHLLSWPFLTWPMADKILHFLLLGAVVFWLNLWLEGRTTNLGRWSLPLALPVPLLVASLEEAAQSWSPVRTASLADWSSDLAGMLFFCWLSYKLMKLNRLGGKDCKA
jgi:membrane-associated phospholipid phosphatase